MNTRAHIAAIATTLDTARDLARQLGIPIHNAISTETSRQHHLRGRCFAGYILAPGCHPNLEFWENFAPCLVRAPHYTAAELRAMLADAEQDEVTHDRRLAELALTPR